MDLATEGISGVSGGKPLFMDVTCVSPVTGRGVPKPRAAVEDGAALNDKDFETRETDYPDVAHSPQAELLSLSVETYGRWNKDSLQLIRQLARAKAENVPEVLRKSVESAYSNRWWSLFSIALQ